ASNNDEYGSVAISIKIADEPAPQSDESFNRHIMAVDADCKVRVQILDSNYDELASGGPWNWSDSILLYQGEMITISIYSGTNDLTGSPIFVYSTTSCEDFDGYWYITEISDSWCYDEVTGFSEATVTQDGCDDVRFSVVGFDGFSTGTVVGSTLYIEPTYFTYDGVTTTYTDWELHINEDNLTGSANWTDSDECSGTSYFSGYR
ncbi:MAG: hypothetical protein JRI91_11445, partial [Deltaproteobacteria bacterium]|nr:hypothetical protein [Deltaproteobacteria bacterium]